MPLGIDSLMPVQRNDNGNALPSGDQLFRFLDADKSLHITNSMSQYAALEDVTCQNPLKAS